MISFRSSKLFWMMLTVLIIAGLFAAFLHHHEAGEESHECPVCRIVQTLAAVFTLIPLAFLGPVLKRAAWLPVLELHFLSSLFVSPRQNRAPPAFSF